MAPHCAMDRDLNFHSVLEKTNCSARARHGSLGRTVTTTWPATRATSGFDTWQAKRERTWSATSAETWCCTCTAYAITWWFQWGPIGSDDNETRGYQLGGPHEIMLSNPLVALLGSTLDVTLGSDLVRNLNYSSAQRPVVTSWNQTCP